MKYNFYYIFFRIVKFIKVSQLQNYNNMKKGLLTFALLTAILLSIAIISAASFTISAPADLTKSVNSTTLTFTTTSVTPMNIAINAIPAISDDDGHLIDLFLSANTITGLVAGTPKTITVSYSTLSSSFALGAYSTTLSAYNTANSADNSTATINLKSGFCEKGKKIDTGNRYLEITKISDASSDTKWKWKPLDKVDIDVKVKFNNDDDSDDSIDGIIELGLYDTVDKVFIDFDDEDSLQKDFSLDEGSSTTETLSIIIPVSDLEDSDDRYKLYVKVYEDGEEDTLCSDTVGSDYFQDIKINKNSYDVAVSDIVLTTPAPCGDEITLTANANNIGTNDEDKVQIKLVNKELGIDLKSDTFSLDEGDSKKVEFRFTVPATAKEKIYSLSLTSLYRYSKSSDTFREESDAFTASLKVEGNCQASTTQTAPQITADLDEETPDAFSGGEVIVKATIKNIGTASTTYTMSVTGNTEWSTLSAIDPSTSFALAAGESKVVKIYLNIDKDASGDKQFTIKATYNGLDTTQNIALTVEKASQNVVVESIKENWFIYLIILVNVILVIAIISVIARIARRRSPGM